MLWILHIIHRAHSPTCGMGFSVSSLCCRCWRDLWFAWWYRLAPQPLYAYMHSNARSPCSNLRKRKPYEAVGTLSCSFTDHAYQRLLVVQQPMAGQQNPTQLQKSSKFKIKLIHTICVQKFLTRRTVYAYPCSILHCTVYKNQRLSIAEWKSHILTISRGPHISTTRSCSSKPALDSFIFRRNSRLYMWLYIQWAETNAHQIQSMNNHNVWTMNNGCM